MMKTLLKITGVIVVVVIIAILALVMTFDANNYKQQIQQQVAEATGRTLTIDGDISLSLMPIGVELGQVRLSNAEGFSAPVFARIESLVVKIKLLPLLKKELAVDALSLKGLGLFLEVNEQGVNNWQDMAKSDGASQTAEPGTEASTEEPADESGASPLAGLAVNGIELLGAEVQYLDDSTDTRVQLSELNLQTGAINFGQAFDMKLSATIEQQQADQSMAAKVAFESQVTLDQSLQQFDLGSMLLTVQADMPAVLPQQIDLTFAADTSIDLANQRVKLSDAEVNFMQVKLMLEMQIQNWQQQLQVDGKLQTAAVNIRNTVTQFDIELPEMRGPNTLSHFKLDTGFSMAGEQIAVSDLKIEFDESRIDGKVDVTLAEVPVVRYQLAMNAIDVDNYMPPATDEVVDDTAGPVEVPETDLPIPFEMLRSQNIKGQFTLGKLKVADIQVSDIDIATAVQGGIIRLDPVTLQVLEGTVETRTTVDVRQDTLKVKQKLKVSQLHIDTIANPIIATLIPNQKVDMKGAGDVYADITTQGIRISALQKQLNGKAGFVFENIKADGLDIEFLARTATTGFMESKKITVKPEWRGEYKPDNVTAFDVVKADFDIKKGVARTDNFIMDSKRIDVTAKGWVNIPEQTMDMRSVTDITPRQLKTAAEKILDAPLPVRASGAWAAPQIDVDYGPMTGVVASMAKDKAKAAVKKKTDKKKQKVKDRLKDKFKGLFR